MGKGKETKITSPPCDSAAVLAKVANSKDEPKEKQTVRQAGGKKSGPKKPLMPYKIRGNELIQRANKSDDKCLKTFMNAGSEVSSREVMLKITKYLDYISPAASASSVLNVTYDMKQDLLAPDGNNTVETNLVLSRVSRAKLWVYPRSVNAQNAEQIFAVLTAVPVVSQGGSEIESAHQQSVVVPPTFTPQWHKVFDCNYDKLYQSAQVQPIGSDVFNLLNTQVVNPDDMTAFADGNRFQFKLEITVAQTVPLRSQIQLGIDYVPNYVSGDTPSGNQLAFVQVTGMRNMT
jgi:hypothetical protein